MNEPKLQITGTETPDAEVELSAEDLLGLAAPCNDNQQPQDAIAKTLSTAATLRQPAVQKRAAPVATRRPMSASRVVVSGILTMGVIGALYFAVASNGGADRSMVKEQALQSPSSQGGGAGEPVRFANPFDPKEVFEFPAGTSEAEARDAVAEMLMERAMERQRKFDARVSDNR